MKITHEKGNDEAWVCICGNTPSDDGFYPVNSFGEWCEPDDSWNTSNYGCNQCGRIIEQTSLIIVGWMTKEAKAKELV